MHRPITLTPELKSLLRKVLKILKEDRTKFSTYAPRRELTADNLESAVGNHLFDNEYSLFNITKKEGHIIRAYFQRSSVVEGYSFVADLHKAFPELMEPEEQVYLDSVNKSRADSGLPPIRNIPTIKGYKTPKKESR